MLTRDEEAVVILYDRILEVLAKIDLAEDYITEAVIARLPHAGVSEPVLGMLNSIIREINQNSF